MVVVDLAVLGRQDRPQPVLSWCRCLTSVGTRKTSPGVCPRCGCGRLLSPQKSGPVKFADLATPAAAARGPIGVLTDTDQGKQTKSASTGFRNDHADHHDDHANDHADERAPTVSDS